MVGYYEHRRESSGSIKGKEFKKLSNYQLSKRDHCFMEFPRNSA
jgi:hypothetical protein